jgi:hypothetical protein
MYVCTVYDNDGFLCATRLCPYYACMFMHSIVALKTYVCIHISFHGHVVEIITAIGDALPLLRVEMPPPQKKREEAQRAQLEEHRCKQHITNIHTYII